MNLDPLSDPDLPPFCDPFDAALAAAGPPAVFTVDADGRLRLDADRTRDAWSRLPGPVDREPTLFLMRDRATGWRQLVLVTAPALALEHPRAEAARLASAAEALVALRAP